MIGKSCARKYSSKRIIRIYLDFISDRVPCIPEYTPQEIIIMTAVHPSIALQLTMLLGIFSVMRVNPFFNG